MEYEQRLTPQSRLFEARNELREHIDLETSLIEQINELPEDDFCHNARESLALGAGYAYLCRHDVKHTEEDVFEAFFSLQPRNNYVDEITVRRTEQALIKALAEPMDDTVDLYVLEELAAFIEGYEVTRRYFMSKILQMHIESSELA